MIIKSTSRSQHRTLGFTLIEVLVAVFVVSVGLLGIAALFTQVHKFNGSALYRVRAITHANDMADRIRANPTARNNFTVARDAAPGTDSQCHQTSTNAAPIACTPAALAQDEIFHWKLGLSTGPTALPNGAGRITYQPATATLPDAYVIRVYWADIYSTSKTDFDTRDIYTVEVEL